LPAPRGDVGEAEKLRGGDDPAHRDALDEREDLRGIQPGGDVARSLSFLDGPESAAVGLRGPGAARIITDIVRLDDPPLRLLLGSDAVESAENASRARAAEAEAWAEVSRSADFPTGDDAGATG